MRRLWMSLLVVPLVAVVALTASSSGTPARAASAARTATAAPAAPGVLRVGMKGSAIKRLQQRLAALKYYPGSIDGNFGLNTEEAVWAFQEVNGLPAEDYVSAKMEKALANPRTPRVLVPKGGADRIEINLGIEVLVLYKNNHIQLISHVSSGGGYYYCSPGGGCGYAITPTGNFHTLSYFPGWLQVPLGEMYNPVFFLGSAYAIHGDIPVPLQPVSHGCVRIPMDIAAFFHTLIKVPGEPVYIRR
jgi:Putative peptidoglycan binding domain/L,D-transpeptidase catalytic domain